MPADISCGIDFGTSNSTVAIAKDHNVSLVAVEDGKTTLPSAIFFTEALKPFYGRDAISAYLDGEDGRLLRGIKKILGTSLMNEMTLIGRRNIAFSKVLSSFIGHLKNQAELAAGQEITKVVMGRPVHFHDNDPGADQKSEETLSDIAKAVGFKDVQFLYEPIAAAFAHEVNIAHETLSLVVDLGGGTSDFSVIKLARNKMTKPDRTDDILANAGVRIGGTNFDARLSLASFMPALGFGSEYRDAFDPDKFYPAPLNVYHQLSEWSLVNHAQTAKAIANTQDILRLATEPELIARLKNLQSRRLGHALLQKTEEVKISLTDDDEASATLAALDPDLVFSSTRQNFETAIAQDIEKIVLTIHECLSLAGVKAQDIGLIIMTGGSTELPIINSIIRDMFPKAEISQDNKLGSVGLGLAYKGAAS